MRLPSIRIPISISQWLTGPSFPWTLHKRKKGVSSLCTVLAITQIGYLVWGMYARSCSIPEPRVPKKEYQEYLRIPYHSMYRMLLSYKHRTPFSRILPPPPPPNHQLPANDEAVSKDDSVAWSFFFFSFASSSIPLSTTARLPKKKVRTLTLAAHTHLPSTSFTSPSSHFRPTFDLNHPPSLNLTRLPPLLFSRLHLRVT